MGLLLLSVTSASSYKVIITIRPHFRFLPYDVPQQQPTLEALNAASAVASTTSSSVSLSAIGSSSQQQAGVPPGGGLPSGGPPLASSSSSSRVPTGSGSGPGSSSSSGAVVGGGSKLIEDLQRHFDDDTALWLLREMAENRDKAKVWIYLYVLLRVVLRIGMDDHNPHSECELP